MDELKNLNSLNRLIDYRTIKRNELHKITLHPLIREITLDDKKPSISNCQIFIACIHNLCLMHGADLPYHNTMFKVIENIILLAEKDDTDKYKIFIKDAFAYMEKYAYKSGMKLIISKLEIMANNNDDRALLFDYKSTYDHICNRNISAALEYELQAVNLCDENTNPHLTANICANMGGLYHSTSDVLNAKIYMEKALNIYAEIYEDEPELTQRKISELQDAVSAYGINAQNLISEN